MRTWEAAALILMLLSLLGSAVWFGVTSIEVTAQSRPYSVYKTDGNGQQKCIYVFGGINGLTSFSDWASGYGRDQYCPALKEQK